MSLVQGQSAHLFDGHGSAIQGSTGKEQLVAEQQGESQASLGVHINIKTSLPYFCCRRKQCGVEQQG